MPYGLFEVPGSQCYIPSMGSLRLNRFFKQIAAYLICIPALGMPYRARIVYARGLSAVLHAPFKFFGAVAYFLLDRLNIEPERDTPIEQQRTQIESPLPRVPDGRIAVLYSGGTDSTCAAALMAREAREVHLLTFFEYATRHSPVPTANVERLRRHFTSVQFLHRTIPVDTLVRFFSYERYGHIVRRYGLLALSTPGFSSLSWHVRTIVYCREHGITRVADGLTRELMHFPGHMDGTVELLRDLYAEFGISYENPVRDWPTPPDRQFIDQVLVNRHDGAFFLGDSAVAQNKTTGRYLFELGIFPRPDIKGSRLDFEMQHDCYPFSLYNVVAFWAYLSREPYVVFAERVRILMNEKVAVAGGLLREYARDPSGALRTMLV